MNRTSCSIVVSLVILFLSAVSLAEGALLLGYCIIQFEEQESHLYCSQNLYEVIAKSHVFQKTASRHQNQNLNISMRIRRRLFCTVSMCKVSNCCSSVNTQLTLRSVNELFFFSF